MAYSTEVWGHTPSIKIVEVVFTAFKVLTRYEVSSYASLKISTQCFRMAEHTNSSTRALSTHYSFFLPYFCFYWEGNNTWYLANMFQEMNHIKPLIKEKLLKNESQCYNMAHHDKNLFQSIWFLTIIILICYIILCNFSLSQVWHLGQIFNASWSLTAYTRAID